MRHFLYDFWKKLEQISVLDTDPPAERRRKVTLVMIAVFCCLTGVMSITWNVITSSPFVEILMPLLFTSVVGIASFTYFITKRFALLLYPFLIMILCIPVFFQISIGGLAAQGTLPIIFWSILAPFGSLMFQNIRKATWWFAAYIVLVLIFLNIDEYFAQFAEASISFSEISSSHSDLMVSYGITIITLSIIVFISMRYYVNAFQKEHSRAEKLVVDLTKTNNELESTLNELMVTQSELVQSEKMAALGKLAAGIAHEINNPIGVLKSTADTSARCVSKIEGFKEQTKQPATDGSHASYQEILNTLKNNAQVFLSVSDRIAKTVNNFINFARLDEAEFDKADIHECLDNTLMLIQGEIKSDISIAKEYGELPKIACYPGDLNQVFMNLILNAIQAIKGEGKITIRTFIDNGNVRIQIIDTGIGIPKEQLKSLFDPRFTKDEKRVKAGLGLFTSYTIMHKHNGDIKVESKVGKGSIFTIVMPLGFGEAGQ
jgi:signal transduction histidine kinase